MAKNYELVKKIAVLGGKEGGNTKEINIVRWGVYPPMIDIRRWKDGEPSKRITLNAEETRLVLRSLIRMKNRLIQEGRYTDCVDELIAKIAAK